MYLLPGEEVRTPLTVLQFWDGDWIRAQNIWRRWMVEHNLPRPGGRLVTTHYGSCWSVTLNPSAEEELALLRELVFATAEQVRAEIEADIQAAYASRCRLAMVDSSKGITPESPWEKTRARSPDMKKRWSQPSPRASDPARRPALPSTST